MTTRRIRNVRPKMTRYEKQALDKKTLEYHQKGTGLYKFRMRSKEAGATLDLPKPAQVGDEIRTRVGPYNPKDPTTGEFIGDDYFMTLVKNHEVTLVQNLTPAVEKEEVMTEQNQPQEELILDQPDQVTPAGKVEHVVVPGQPGQPQPQQLNEVPNPQGGQGPKDVLINEDPLDGVEIILD